MNAAHVAEVATVLHARGLLSTYRGSPEVFRSALFSPRPRDLDRLLERAVDQIRAAAAADVRAARLRARLSRAELADATGVTPSYVARAARLEARVDPDFVRSVRAIRRAA